MCTKYQVSISSPVPGEVCTDDADTNTDADAGRRCTRVDKPNEPKINTIKWKNL